MNSKVLFFTCAYNAEETIHKSINSIINQTHKNWVYYVLDNGSTDKTGNIIRKYTEQDDRVKMITVPVNDLINYPNTAFRKNDLLPKVDYSWLAILDSDDEYAPMFAEKSLKYAKESGLDLVCVSSDRNYSGKLYRGLLNDRIFQNPEDYIDFPSWYNITFPFWGKLYHRSIVDSLRKEYVDYSDFKLSLEAMTHAKKIGVISEILHHVRGVEPVDAISEMTDSEELYSYWVNFPDEIVKAGKRFFHEKCGRITKHTEDILFYIAGRQAMGAINRIFSQKSQYWRDKRRPYINILITSTFMRDFLSIKNYGCETDDPSVLINKRDELLAHIASKMELHEPKNRALWYNLLKMRVDDADTIIKYIIIGAGFMGKYALTFLTEDRVFCFADNSPEKIGTIYCGKLVIPVSAIMSLPGKYKLILAIENRVDIAKQLADMGINEDSYDTFNRDDNPQFFAYGSFNTSTNNMRRFFLEIYGTESYPHECINEISKIDFIENPEVAIDYEKYVKKIHDYETFYGKENLINYGYVNALMNYAKLGDQLDIEKIFSYPTVFHGVNYAKIRHYEFVLVLCGCHQLQDLQNKRKAPVFSVGPYIRYASHFYSNDELHFKKQANGNTLLIFPYHSDIFSKSLYDVQAFVNYVLEEAKAFDSVIACFYHLDYNTKLREQLESHGVKIVCAGLINDISFVKRLKSILYLADAVVTNGLGAHIPFALEEGKPVKFFRQKLQMIGNSDRRYLKEHYITYTNMNSPLILPFVTDEWCITDEQIRTHELYAGFSIHKTPEQMRAIFDVSELLFKECDGCLHKYRRTLEGILLTLQDSKSEKEALMFSELEEWQRLFHSKWS